MVPGLGSSSASKTLPPGSVKGTISSCGIPSARARAYARCERTAQASCSSRPMPNSTATSPASTETGAASAYSMRWSASSSVTGPMRVPHLTRDGRTSGTRERFSTPKTTATRTSPARTARSAIWRAAIEEQHARSSVRDGTVGGRPAFRSARRATTGATTPASAGAQQPPKTSSTSAGSTPARASAPRIAAAARSTAGTSRSAPPNFPNAVRA